MANKTDLKKLFQGDLVEAFVGQTWGDIVDMDRHFAMDDLYNLWEVARKEQMEADCKVVCFMCDDDDRYVKAILDASWGKWTHGGAICHGHKLREAFRANEAEEVLGED